MSHHVNPNPAALLANNKTWAKEFEAAHPGFLAEIAKKQHPKVLWIGCADSRVPESVITNSFPGDIFVHRNIANLFELDDINASSVLAYAIEHSSWLDICTGCGGVEAAYKEAHHFDDHGHTTGKGDEVILQWLKPLIELAKKTTKPDPSIPKKILDQLSKDNAQQQVANIRNSEIFKPAAGKVSVEAWIYDLPHGELSPVQPLARL